MALLEDGRLKALAVSSMARATALPNVPTTTEAGYPNSDYNFWAGVMVPKGTPRPIIETLYREIEKALQLPDVKAKIRSLGADPMPMTSAEFGKLLADEVRMNKELVKSAGIKVN